MALISGNFVLDRASGLARGIPETNCIHRYGNTDDTLAEIMASGYFNDIYGSSTTGTSQEPTFRVGDVILITGSDGETFVKITAVSPNVTVSNLYGDGSVVLTDNQIFVGLNEILNTSAGTWTRTRIAAGNYVLRHTVANDTTIIGIDLTPAIRTATGKGFSLTSLDVIYSIGTLALDAHSLALYSVSYANNIAVSPASIALTGSLATATQTNPYVSNLAVTTPAFLNTADSKYVAELTVDAAATSAYDFYGLNLRFSSTSA